MGRTLGYSIETPETFKKYMQDWAIKHNTTLSNISAELGYSARFLYNTFQLRRISRAAVRALAQYMGVSVDDILSHMQAPKVEETPAPVEEPVAEQTVEDLARVAQAVKDLTDAVDLLNEINKQQLQSLQQLAQMFARTWCK